MITSALTERPSVFTSPEASRMSGSVAAFTSGRRQMRAMRVFSILAKIESAASRVNVIGVSSGVVVCSSDEGGAQSGRPIGSIVTTAL